MYIIAHIVLPARLQRLLFFGIRHNKCMRSDPSTTLTGVLVEKPGEGEG